MENKKTFGAYICRRRKELGLTQREFADRLFVTESAVSKWERGMSYPDTMGTSSVRRSVLTKPLINLPSKTRSVLPFPPLSA